MDRHRECADDDENDDDDNHPRTQTKMSLPAMHPAKRRRLEQSASTLSKPFRSPLRVDVNKQKHAEEDNNEKLQIHPPYDQDDATPQRDVASSRTDPQCAQVVTQIASSPLPRLTVRHPTSHSSPTRPSRPLLSSSPTRNNQKTPEYLALQKQHTALLQELSQIRQSIDTAKQALKIQSSSQTTELENLFLKWRSVAREAAEELFRSAKDRVNRMGGLKAWQEQTQKQRPPWEEEDQMQAMQDQLDDESLTEEQRELMEGYREEMAREKEMYGDDREDHKPKMVAPKDDESYTIDMMLKYLNIELDLIGYDTEQQRWTD